MSRRNEEKCNWAMGWHNMDRDAQTIHHKSSSTQSSLSIQMAHHCFNCLTGNSDVIERGPRYDICYKSIGKKCWSSQRQGILCQRQEITVLIILYCILVTTKIDK